jgi:Siphovirus Gp157
MTTVTVATSPLWEIEEDLEALLDSLDSCPEELREELSLKIETYVGRLASKVDSIAGVLKSLEAVQENAKNEIDRLRAREKAAERAQNRLEGYVLEVLRKRPDQKLKGKWTTFGIRTSEALVIVDPNLVPAEWKSVVQTVTVPKEPIKRALKMGEDIPGVAIEVREHLSRR